MKRLPAPAVLETGERMSEQTPAIKDGQLPAFARDHASFLRGEGSWDPKAAARTVLFSLRREAERCADCAQLGKPVWHDDSRLAATTQGWTGYPNSTRVGSLTDQQKLKHWRSVQMRALKKLRDAESNMYRADAKEAAASGRFHPLLTIFPTLDDIAFSELVADIRTNGVREPIWTYKGQIVDGRNRWLACQQLGIGCPEREYEGDEKELPAFVVSLNVHRRHLDASQRAMVAAKIANMKHGGDRKSDQRPNLGLDVSINDAAEMLNVSTGSIDNAKAVIAKAEPEVVVAVEQGRLAVSVASKIAGHPPEVQRQAVAKIEGGAKGGAVVRAPPTSGGKARPSKDAVRTTRGDAGDPPPIPQWVSRQLLELDTTGALSLDAADIFAQMSRDERRDVARVVKQLIPWLQSMIKASAGRKVQRGSQKKMSQAVKLSRSGETEDDPKQMLLPVMRGQHDDR